MSQHPLGSVRRSGLHLIARSSLIPAPNGVYEDIAFQSKHVTPTECRPWLIDQIHVESENGFNLSARDLASILPTDSRRKRSVNEKFDLKHHDCFVHITIPALESIARLYEPKDSFTARAFDRARAITRCRKEARLHQRCF